MLPVINGGRNIRWWQHLRRQSGWLAAPAMLMFAGWTCMADLASGQPFGADVTVTLAIIGVAAFMRNRMLLFGAGVGLMLIALFLAALWLLHPILSNSQTRFQMLIDAALLIIAACVLTLIVDAWQRRALNDAQPEAARAVTGPQPSVDARAVNGPQPAVDARAASLSPGPRVLALQPAAPFLHSTHALPVALRDCTAQHGAGRSAPLTFNTHWDEPPLPLTHVNMLFQFALDALRERSPHAASDGLEVSIIATRDAAWVDVQDNGPCFTELDLALPVALYRQRAERLGGALEIRSGDAQRNTLRMRVAIPQR